MTSKNDKIYLYLEEDPGLLPDPGGHELQELVESHDAVPLDALIGEQLFDCLRGELDPKLPH